LIFLSLENKSFQECGADRGSHVRHRRRRRRRQALYNAGTVSLLTDDFPEFRDSVP
jgi:hypothetical protein